MEFSIWENILLGIMVLGVIFWMKPGIKSSLLQSKSAKSDWMGFLIPISLVVMFVIFLVVMV